MLHFAFQIKGFLEFCDDLIRENKDSNVYTSKDVR